MKTKILIAVSILCWATVVSADSSDDPYKTNGDPNYRYKSSSGTGYQYDLSNPADKIRYEVDVSAQVRDSINVNPMVDIDRDLGQVGGGIRR